MGKARFRPQAIIEDLNRPATPEAVLKIGEFIYPWGSGHYSRMMRLDGELAGAIGEDLEVHYSSKGHVYQKLLDRFPSRRDRIHEILMPTPIDGDFGPSITLSMMNLLVSVSDQPPLVRQIASYLRAEGRLYNREGFDLVINDGDMGSNILAERRGIPSMFVTNQFRPKLYRSRMYFYPSLIFVARQISKATRIIVADSPPPHTMCEYNLNFTGDVKDRVEYVGHFTAERGDGRGRGVTDLGRLVQDCDFGYWMITGDESTNRTTGRRYEEAFRAEGMGDERRVVSHAGRGGGGSAAGTVVTGRDGRRYSVEEALERRVDWIQIDAGFLSEDEKDDVLDGCRYAVVNGSHTAMGEVMGGKAKPVIGLPVYDEHTNQIRWAQERNLGVLANNAGQVVGAIRRIREDYSAFEDALNGFARNFVGGGAQKAAGIAAQLLNKT